ncbi:TPA: hypothetical protein ACK3Q6_002683 [Burkholderia cepacia]|uniref:hypothetical protein n=1 Tax=Burkholderia cepacia TaxID=292 RepID=UPI001CF48731|nr:hypothetical protein [Burkholderia cepacia]HDR9764255.1 hypothetical protein [Burkholderia cepacia ATCC 25416]MCA8361208.1 hypothetical protein [Burkholderia cepacia]MDO5943296.1 hypothetical protein [Burkholderia cepacia]HDR9769780.1 hypothetical protein [Burkholderia cepacia ATCC 25416]HDR9779881.1 hypothetical protein [Burkholderia cepacia ATCC 25416]
MKKIMLAAVIGIASISVAQACEIEPHLKKCGEAIGFGSGEVKAKITMDGTHPEDFTFKRIGNFLRIAYTGDMSKNRTGTIEITKADGTTSTRPMSIRAKEYDLGNGAITGLKSILDEMKPAK